MWESFFNTTLSMHCALHVDMCTGMKVYSVYVHLCVRGLSSKMI